MEMAEGAGGAEHPPEHSTDAAAATNENGMHPRREYDKVASEGSVGGQASAGPAPAEDGHGDTHQIERTQREEGREENPRRANSEQEPTDGGESPPRTVARA